MTGPATDWLARRAQLSPERVALIDAESGERICFGEWNGRAERAARRLLSAGVGRGDRVAVLAENAPAVLDLLFACGKLGAVFMPLNWRLAAPELAAQMAHAGPAVLCCDDAMDGRGRALEAPARISLAELADAPRRGALPRPSLTHDDPWVLCYTGGSTGAPRGVVQTHGGILWNAINTVASWELGAGDAAIVNAPLFHTGGLHVFATPLVHAGGASILCRRFDPDQVFDLVGRGEATLLFGVPTMFVLLEQHPRWPDADLSRLRLIIAGGAPAPARLFESFFARGVDLRIGYGLTEAGPNNFWLPRELARSRPGSIGHPLLHVEARLVDDSGAVIDRADEVGELQLRGPHVMAGYFRDPEATAAAMGQGWLATGDLARRDADGAYWIAGRRKEMFISGGENVHPAEVESALCDHPAVAAAAVVGVPDPVWGEVGVAFVALRSPDPAPMDDLAGFLARRLARYKLPRRYERLADLPRTGAGKVDRADLRRRAAEMTSASKGPSAPSAPPPPAVAQPDASDSSPPAPARSPLWSSSPPSTPQPASAVGPASGSDGPASGVGVPPGPARPKNFSAR
jgi:fatty-acyl-CoA synthase